MIYALSIRNGGTYFLRETKGCEPLHQNKVALCLGNPQDPSVDLGKATFNMLQIHIAFQHA